jgi:hypothetical protein
MHRGPLGLAKPYPIADTAQLLDGNAAPGAFSLGHDTFADIVVDICCEALLFATTFLQAPPRRCSSFGLQPLAQMLLPLAVAIQPRTGGLVSVTGRSDVDDSQIDSDEPVLGTCSGASGASMVAYRNHFRPGGSGRFPQWNWSATAPDPRRSKDPEVAQPSVYRPDRHGRFRPPIVSGICQDRHRASYGWAALSRKPIASEHLCAAGRAGRTVVACGDIGPQRGIGIGNLADNPDRRLRRQLKSHAQLGIEPL